MTGPEQHANTVREQIPAGHYGTCSLGKLGRKPCDCGKTERDAAYAALDALVALANRADTLESELATATTTMEVAIRKLEAAEARADELQRNVGRDAQELFDRWDEMHRNWQGAEERTDTLERERDEALDREHDALELARGRGEAAVREANRAPEIRRAYEGKLADAAVECSLARDEAQQARAEADRLREALREIERYEDGSKGVEHCSDIARAALAGPQTKEQT